ncbi:hypothetical protein, partial [Acinetobacter baumannii]|uniref:hypothetical protein n=1 Tax=Acinetobacter baumannii TaxID=470 RepID=UPI001C082480
MAPLLGQDLVRDQSRLFLDNDLRSGSLTNLWRKLQGFYPEITDGCKRAENFWSCLATLRRILGLWNRSMYSNT